MLGLLRQADRLWRRHTLLSPSLPRYLSPTQILPLQRLLHECLSRTGESGDGWEGGLCGLYLSLAIDIEIDRSRDRCSSSDDEAKNNKKSRNPENTINRRKISGIRRLRGLEGFTLVCTYSLLLSFVLSLPFALSLCSCRRCVCVCVCVVSPLVRVEEPPRGPRSLAPPSRTPHS